MYLLEESKTFWSKIYREFADLKNICTTSVTVDPSLLENEHFDGSFRIKFTKDVDYILLLLFSTYLMEEKNPLGDLLYLQISDHPIVRLFCAGETVYFDTFHKYYIDEELFLAEKSKPENFLLPGAFEQRYKVTFLPYKKFDYQFALIFTEYKKLNSSRKFFSLIKRFKQEVKYKLRPKFNFPKRPKEVRRIGVGYRDKGSRRDISEQRNVEIDTTEENNRILQLRLKSLQTMYFLRGFCGAEP